jgi:hypothetical protein
VRVNDEPLQIVPLFTETTGKLTTFTLTMAGAGEAQPNALVPHTVYVAFADGLTIAVPEEYVYVLAPEGIMVKELPAQMLPLLTDTTGNMCTVTLAIAGADWQPLMLVPVTV